MPVCQGPAVAKDYVPQDVNVSPSSELERSPVDVCMFACMYVVCVCVYVRELCAPRRECVPIIRARTKSCGCMYVCMYVCSVCVCMYVRELWTARRECAPSMYLCMYVCMYVCTVVHVCVCMNVCIIVCMYVDCVLQDVNVPPYHERMPWHVCICMYVCVYVCTM
jgi:hypothetical protein